MCQALEHNSHFVYNTVRKYCISDQCFLIMHFSLWLESIYVILTSNYGYTDFIYLLYKEEICNTGNFQNYNITTLHWHPTWRCGRHRGVPISDCRSRAGGCGGRACAIDGGLQTQGSLAGHGRRGNSGGKARTSRGC